VLACNGWRIRRLDDAALTLAPGILNLSFLVARDQRLLTLLVQLPSADNSEPVILSPADKASGRAASLRKAWLAG
jgi:hypothetical protein